MGLDNLTIAICNAMEIKYHPDDIVSWKSDKYGLAYTNLPGFESDIEAMRELVGKLMEEDKKRFSICLCIQLGYGLHFDLDKPIEVFPDDLFNIINADAEQWAYALVETMSPTE